MGRAHETIVRIRPATIRYRPTIPILEVETSHQAMTKASGWVKQRSHLYKGVTEGSMIEQGYIRLSGDCIAECPVVEEEAKGKGRLAEGDGYTRRKTGDS